MGPPTGRYRIRVGEQDCLDHGLQQLTHQPRRGLRQGFAQQAGRVNNVWCGHRDGSSRILWKVDSKDHAVTASSSDEHAGDGHSDRATPLSGTQLCLALGLVEVASDQLVWPVTGKSDVKAAHNDFVND